MCGLNEWEFDSEKTPFSYDRFHMNFSPMTGDDFFTDG